MFTLTHIHALLFAALFTSITFADSSQGTRVATNATAVINEEQGTGIAANSTFYTFRQDMRKCASPLCGGYFVKRVNQSLTRCANGRNLPECYVTSIEWNDANKVEPQRGLLRGSLVARGNRNGQYGVLNVTESWQAVTPAKRVGDYYRVRDLGIRCITAPCETHLQAKLNTATGRKITGVSLTSTGASEEELGKAQKAMTGDQGVILIGSVVDVTGPGGRSKTLNATQLYLRTIANAALKPCIKTGCSAQICSDEMVTSTCEWRPEYECYKKAICERQANGNCGFTKTPELTNCLARTRGGVSPAGRPN
jgi:Domain of unknown function (DUF6748)